MDVKGSFLYSVDDPSIASVDADGNVTGLGNGTTTVTVTMLPSGRTASVPLTVTESASSDEPTYNQVILPGDSGEGAVRADHTSAEAGQVVTIAVSPAYGYIVGFVTVRDAGGSLIPVTNNGDGTYSFVMPDGGVTVDVRFIEDWEDEPHIPPIPIVPSAPETPASGTAYPVVLSEPSAGSAVTSDRAVAEPGQTVTVTPVPGEGYRTGTVTVRDPNGGEIPVTDNGDGTYSFVMPDGAVAVDVTFGEKLPAQPANVFTDVPDGTWYSEAVAWAVAEGITNGTDATHFTPDAPCTRAQTVTFLWRAAGKPEPSGTVMPFVDVVSGSYYEKAVLWAVEQGITKGVDETHFAPDATVTRAQTVTFLYRFAKASAEAKKIFADVSLDDWFAEAVTWAWENDITKGTSETLFSPDASCVRAQIVTFLYRYMKGR